MPVPGPPVMTLTPPRSAEGDRVRLVCIEVHLFVASGLGHLARRVQQGRGDSSQPIAQGLGHLDLGRVEVGPPDPVCLGDHRSDRLPALHSPVQIVGGYPERSDALAQQGTRRVTAPLTRQDAEHVHHGRLDTTGVVRRQPLIACQTVRCEEAHPGDLVHEAVGVHPNHGRCPLSVALPDPQDDPIGQAPARATER